MIEIRWHGRGGQGAVTAAKILASAAVKDGMYGVAIPFFGAERRGAPVVAYNRISEGKIRVRGGVRSPDIVVVLDPYLVRTVDVVKGLKPSGTVVANCRGPCIGVPRGRIAYVDATGIATRLGLKIAGIPLVNMPILGALAASTRVVSLESLEMAVVEEFGDRAGRNLEALRVGAGSVRVIDRG